MVDGGKGKEKGGRSEEEEEKNPVTQQKTISILLSRKYNKCLMKTSIVKLKDFTTLLDLFGKFYRLKSPAFKKDSVSYPIHNLYTNMGIQVWLKANNKAV